MLADFQNSLTLRLTVNLNQVATLAFEIFGSYSLIFSRPWWRLGLSCGLIYVSVCNVSLSWLNAFTDRAGFFYGRPMEYGRHYIFALWSLSFYLSFFLSFFFSSPNLSRRRLDVYRTSTHDVALVRKIAIWAPSHKFVGLYLRNYGTCRQSEKTC